MKKTTGQLVVELAKVRSRVKELEQQRNDLMADNLVLKSILLDAENKQKLHRKQ